VLVVKDESGLVGCVAVEPYDDAAVLRSLAVVPERRGRGLGWILADCAVQRARALGAQRLYLLTETASDFFAEKLGFRAVDRSIVDAPVAASAHFRDSARSAVAMRLDLYPGLEQAAPGPTRAPRPGALGGPTGRGLARRGGGGGA
jgi:N-acetylglutamate synthase-like GNAT family acetyltransferase